MNKILIPIFLFGLFASSCVNPKRNIKLSQIDSLLNEIHVVNSQIAELKMDSVNLIIAEMKFVVDLFKETDPNSQTNDDFKLFDHSANIHKIFKKFQGAYTLAQKELTNSEHQLVSLRHDVEYDLVVDSLFNQYLNTERKIISELHFTYDNKLRMFNDKIDLYNIIKDDVLLMIDRMKDYPKVKKDEILD